jgi:hypothetical protein
VRAAFIELIKPGVEWLGGRYLLFFFDLDHEMADLTPTEWLHAARKRQFGVKYDMSALYKPFHKQRLQELASILCRGASETGPIRRPSVPEIEFALEGIVRKGLPLNSAAYLDSALIRVLPEELQTASRLEDELLMVAHLDTFLRSQLDNFEMEELAHVARILFAHAPGTKGTGIGQRQSQIAEILNRDAEHVRKEIRPKIITALAWQIYRHIVNEEG